MRHFRTPLGSTIPVFVILLCSTSALGVQAAQAQEAPLIGEEARGLDAPPARAEESSLEETRASDVLASDAPPHSEVVSAEVLAGTTLPLDVSIGARLVLARRFFVETSIGRSAYGGLVGSVALSLGGEETAVLIEPAFSGAWIVRLGVGVRPFGQDGPELSVGYARLGSTATWSAADHSLPSSAGALSAEIRLHMVYVELRWSLDVYGPVFIRPAIGWSQVMSAAVQLSSSAELSRQAATALISAGSAAEAVVEQYGKTPTLSLALGARF